MTSPLSSAKRIVVKIGSALLIDYERARPRQDWLASLAEDVTRLRVDGKQVVIVSSGSIALGRFALGLKATPRLEEKQAAAAAGQARLMHAYETVFATYNTTVAQALLTPDDTERRLGTGDPLCRSFCHCFRQFIQHLARPGVEFDRDLT